MKKFLHLFSLTAVMLSGCTSTFLVKMSPQSHFDYPNSNVYPMTHVEGKASKTGLMGPTMSSAMQYEAITNALSKAPGSEMLLNSIHLMDVTQIWIFTTTTYRVEGMAAKMKAGEKELR